MIKTKPNKYIIHKGGRKRGVRIGMEMKLL